MMKRNFAILFIFLLAIVPLLFSAYTDYLVHSSGLDGWQLVLAIKGGAFESPFTRPWTLFVTGVGALFFFPKGWNYFAARRTSAIVIPFVFFLFFVVLNALARPANLLGNGGEIFRYFDYFFLAPFLVVLAEKKLRTLWIPLYGAIIIISLAMLLPQWGSISWSEITYARNYVGKGHVTSMAASFLAVAYGVFLLNGIGLSRKHMQVSRRTLEVCVFLVSALVIFLTFSRGAILAMFVTFAVYFGLKTIGSRRARVMFLAGLLITTIALVFLLDEIVYVMSRQGELRQLDTGRFDLWAEQYREMTSSVFNFVFGVDFSTLEVPAHNLFLGILEKYGILAFLAYVVFHFNAMMLVWRYAKSSKYSDNDFALRALAACVGILFAASFENTFFLNATLLPFLYYFLVGLFVVLECRRVSAKIYHTREFHA